MNRFVFLLAAVVSVAPVFGQQGRGGATPLHADSQLAQELLRLKQTDALKAKVAEAGTAPAGNLWKAQLILATWDDAAKPSEKEARTREYVDALSAYTKATPSPDGAWALAHAQFLLTKLSQPIIMRMEYFANNAKDRETLKPLADLADGLLDRATASLDAAMKAAESKQPFDEKAYMRAYGASADARYYAAWGSYFQAMTIDPAGGGEAGARRVKLLADAAVSLNEWAVDDTDNGINFAAYLLRGKVLSESNEFPKALQDFTKAQSEKAPGWVVYQARYQSVVTNLRAKDFKAAQTTLDQFRRSIPKDNVEAILSAEMLGYRVASAVAESKTTEADRKEARLAALGQLSAVIEKDPRFKDLVYQQLAAQVPEKADLATLMPMQQLAVAYFESQGQKGDTPESRKRLQQAIDAATLVAGNKDATKPNKVEATYLIGVCHAVMGNLPEAAKHNLEFAEAAPQDTRAKPMVELALQQVGELYRLSGSAAGGGGGVAPEVRALHLKALDLAVGTYGLTQWRYRHARALEEEGMAGGASAAAMLTRAATLYEQIPANDKFYLDARYRLVSLATTRFSGLAANTPEREMQSAAQAVFKACSAYVELLDRPPATVSAEDIARVQPYRYDIWIIETDTALHPAVRQAEVALDRLSKLDAAREKLTEAQRGAVLRYRIKAYQMANQPDKAFAVVQEYAKAHGQDAMAVIRSMALSTLEEINKVEASDPAQAKRLATYVVQLFDPIIKQSAAEGKADNAFEYRLIQADMMIRAGQGAEATKLALEMQKEKPGDIRSFMTEARALFAGAEAKKERGEYAKAQDLFTRILQRLSPGSEGFWECWLRIIEAMEAQRGDAARSEIQAKLKDLKGIYGSKLGGELFKPDFNQLILKYGV